MSDRRRANAGGPCRAYDGTHRWIDQDGRLCLAAPTSVGVHVHTCMHCGCSRQTIVAENGDRSRKYTHATYY